MKLNEYGKCVLSVTIISKYNTFGVMFGNYVFLNPTFPLLITLDENSDPYYLANKMFELLSNIKITRLPHLPFPTQIKDMVDGITLFKLAQSFESILPSANEFCQGLYRQTFDLSTKGDTIIFEIALLKKSNNETSTRIDS